MKAKKQSRHGVRAADKTQTSISLRADLLEAAKAQAESEGRTFSNWLSGGETMSHYSVLACVCHKENHNA